jgi:bifunctional non-homologous end joining protein LigD
MALNRDIATDYYRRVAPFLLYHLKNVPVAFKRYPDAIDGESFWEKDAPSFTPEWVRTFAVPRRSGDSDIHYIVIDDLRTLTWIAEIGGIELHPFLHRAPRIERATSMVFDLDPGEGVTLAGCCEIALLVRDALEVESFVKVSGSKGLQVYVPVTGAVTHRETEAFARAVAEELARSHPARITARMGKVCRAGKVFIDYSQNADYKTTVGVYSLRATGRVSMPVTWDEVKRARGLEFGPEEALARLREVGDLWKPMVPRNVGRASARHRPAEAGRYTALPRRRSQSGRRLFVMTDNELWLEIGGRFKRFGDGYKGEADIDPKYYRGEVPRGWDVGSYEVIEGSFERGSLEIWLKGKKRRLRVP